MTVTYDPCQQCGHPVTDRRRRKYCTDACMNESLRQQRIDGANRFKTREGGSRAFHLKQRYGISEEQYEEMFNRQGGRCAVCRRKSKRVLHVDHDHVTKRVRGLLCFKCNTAIGKLGDDPARIHAAAEYVEAYRDCDF